MTERTIFMEALGKDTEAQRSAYLDETCGNDPALRQRVETLLQSHADVGGFLEKSVPERLSERSGDPEESAATQGDVPASRGEEKLAFLAPSDKPDSLGRLGHYEVLEIIGRGGMGVVLRAFDEKLHRVVAIKVMAAQLATNATARKRFTREAQAQAAVSHDHIVTIHAVEEANGLPYLVMQYVAGMSLQERLEKIGPLRLHEILRIGMQAAAGLAAAHAQGLVHRDIKPANILLENGVERVKITDFGLARAATEASLTQSGVVAGTPQYMSPEQAEGKAIDQRTDLFSLGSVLYAMCTGRAPFRASGMIAVLKRVCEETPTPIRETNPDIPDWLVAIIDKLHAKDPAQRHQSAAEVAELLGRHLAHVQHPSVVPLHPSTGRGAGIEGLSPAQPRRRRLAVAAAVFLCFVVCLGLTEATGVTKLRSTVIRIFTPEGTLVVETDDHRAKAENDGFVPIFNGKDLTGWTADNGGSGRWKVVDGAITASGENSYLYTDSNVFGDFHLRAEVKINDRGNSGIYFRTGKPVMSIGDYEAQITNNAGQRYKTGSLYGLAQAKEQLIPADTWFTYEIIVQGDRIRLLIDGKETADYSESRPNRRAKGHIVLQQYDALTQVRFRKIEIRETKPTKAVSPRSEPQAFVLLGKGIAERTFDTLAEAVLSSSDGDSIEIRGNGPFVTNPIHLGKTALTIRAGEGFRPVIKLSSDGLRAGAPLLKSEAALVLEGLELQRLAQVRKEGPPYQVVLTTSKALHVANCRFLMSKTPHCVSSTSPECELRNCELLCADNDSVMAVSDFQQSGQRLVIDNCLLTAFVRVNTQEQHKGQGAFVQLTRNTFRTGLGAFWFFQVFDKARSPEDLEQRAKILTIEISGNILDAGFIFQFEQAPPDKILPGRETESHLARTIGWVGDRNLYAGDSPFFRLVGIVKPTTPVKNLADWKRFWATAEANSIEGRVRYQGGDLLARLLAAPEKLTPEDFRLRPDSAGYRAGKDGKDLGADVDLVGPGAAYERWKTTPAYQQWLVETGQFRAKASKKPEQKAFVLQGGKGVAERMFDNLADAVLSASDGDTIEIRGNGPFVSAGVKIRQRLVIRAGTGYTPSITLSPEAADKNTPLLHVRAPLVLEGLELRRIGGAGEDVEGRGPKLIDAWHPTELHIANSRLIFNADPLGRTRGILIGTRAANMTVRNCELTVNVLFVGQWHYAAGGRCAIENCVITSGAFGFHNYDADFKDVSVRVRGSTLVGHCLDMTLWRNPSLPEAGEATPPVRLELAGNVAIWDVTTLGFLYFHQSQVKAPVSAAQAEALLPRLVRLDEKRNVYRPGTPMLRLAVDWQRLNGKRGRDLADWDTYWAQKNTGSVKGDIRLEGGDIFTRAQSSPTQLSAADFRLRPDSAGYRAGKDGKDLGADVDLVGPGPAYERWKKTPEYQQWLKDTKQVK